MFHRCMNESELEYKFVASKMPPIFNVVQIEKITNFKLWDNYNFLWRYNLMWLVCNICLYIGLIEFFGTSII